MESLRVDICYRPLRIGWAIRAGDFDAFRSAAKRSFALWGGRFNPIIIVDHEKSARNLVELFRLDMVVPIGDSDIVKNFPKHFPHLIKPFFEDDVFVSYGDEFGARSHVLDVHNLLVHIQREPEWEAIKKKGIRLFSWEPHDPLADIFLIQLGGYPSLDDVHTDYRRLLTAASDATEAKIELDAALSFDLLDHPTISFVSRYGVERHHSVQVGWDAPGFYSGDTKNLDDLVCCWNLRASDIPLLFVDPTQIHRYGDVIESWDKMTRQRTSRRRHEFDRQTAVWALQERFDQRSGEYFTEVLKPFGNKEFSVYRASSDLSGVVPPMMSFGETSTLGVISNETGKPRVSFSLADKPFCDDFWFHTQHLIASLAFLGGLYGDEQHMLVPPFIPELNEFYGRVQLFEHEKARSEFERIGLVVDAADTSAFIDALPVAELFQKIFALAGFVSSISEGGLIARQLIMQLGGVDGARVFKIPGVRRLLKTHGPRAPFSKKSALELIGSKDPDNPGAIFTDYERLYIEPRDHATKLNPEAVFTYLVDKGLFRIGALLKCPHCRLDSWTALDILKQRLTCELCGRDFDATRQLVGSTWHYRRTGVLGGERNAQGAIPVVLTLQQFQANMSSLRRGVYSPSLNLEPKGELDLPRCEVDFVLLIPQTRSRRTQVVIGECKDRGKKRKTSIEEGDIDEKDVANLRRVADAFPTKRFETFIALVKLSPFTENEIALAKTLNDKYTRRVILLTSRELEPYHFYERTKLEFKGIRDYGGSPKDLANTTAEIYFKETKGS